MEKIMKSNNRSPLESIINENDEVKERRRNIAMEYLKMEDKQTTLCNNLATKIYRKFDEANKIEKLCDPDDLGLY
jgi:hypothetical protein